jgi:DNA polymerase III subunit delta'
VFRLRHAGHPGCGCKLKVSAASARFGYPVSVALPGTFAAFHGNHRTVTDLRAAIAAGRFPHSLILAGPRGSGKYTLALLLTLALECERQPRDTDPQDGRPLAAFCGQCRNCTRISEAADLEARVADAVTARDEMRETDKKETRVLVQTHPDVLIVPPDPPQNLIKVGQIRTVIGRAQYIPTEAPARVFLLTSAALMKEAANSLLKLLEEPPDRVHLILLAENTGELLPTIRSRCAVARLGALPLEEILALLAERRPELKRSEAELVARLAEGAAGHALALDLPAYLAARNDAFTLIASAEHTNDHAALFRMTETYRAGAEGQEKTLALLRAAAGLLEDILLLQHNTRDRVRNIDRLPDLQRLADTLSFASVERALRGLDEVYTGMRRNLLRSLSLDAFAVSLA